MSADNITKPAATDILSIMRELDRKDAENHALTAETKATADDKAAHASKIDIDPSKLLSSLRTKRDLLNIINGHTRAKETKEIDQITEEINDAISFLTKLVDGDEPRCES